MSYSESLELVQNDYGNNIEFQITENDSGDAVNLTGASTIKCFIAEPEATTAKVSGTCDAVDAENGLCKYTVQNGDFDEGDKTYEVEVELTYSSKVITARGGVIIVKKELPESEAS